MKPKQSKTKSLSPTYKFQSNWALDKLQSLLIKDETKKFFVERSKDFCQVIFDEQNKQVIIVETPCLHINTPFGVVNILSAKNTEDTVCLTKFYPKSNSKKINTFLFNAIVYRIAEHCERNSIIFYLEGDPSFNDLIDHNLIIGKSDHALNY